jgi:hypothetical protein
MAFLRRRANGMYSLSFWWKGKSYIRALGTDNEAEAKQIKKDAEEQLDRIRKGKSAVASRLLADGHSILDVPFASDKTAHLIGQETADDNPLTLSELRDGYIDYLRTNGRSPAHLEGTRRSIIWMRT